MSAREQITHERRLQRERLWVTGTVYYLPSRARLYQGRALDSFAPDSFVSGWGLFVAGLCSFALVLFFFALFTFTLSK